MKRRAFHGNSFFSLTECSSLQFFFALLDGFYVHLQVVKALFTEKIMNFYLKSTKDFLEEMSG